MSNNINPLDDPRPTKECAACEGWGTCHNRPTGGNVGGDWRCSVCGGSGRVPIEPVIAVDAMIDSLDLHANDVKPPADTSASIYVDLKHEKADIKFTERLP